MISEIIDKKVDDFSRLPDQECASLISSQLLEALESELYLEWQIIAKFMAIPYELRDNLCDLFSSALKKNTEKLGGQAVNVWLKKYLDQYAFKERGLNTFFEFTSNSHEIKKLFKEDQLKLMRILRMYDYLFVTPPLDLEGLAVANIFRFTMQGDYETQKISSQISFQNQPVSVPKQIIIEKIILSEALKKYPEAGEQLITSQKIELKSFPEPVRPSVKNWLADYVHLLGYEDHDAIERTNYLFHTTNTHHLSEADRERLACILKAFDEKTPINIDPVRKQIIFNFPANRQIVPSPPAKRDPLLRGEVEFGKHSSMQKTQDPPDIYEMYRIKKTEPEEKLSAGKMFSPKIDSNIQEAKFDFPQKMPYEKAQEHVSRSSVKSPSSHGTSTYHVAENAKPANSNLQPYRITPFDTRKNEDPRPPVNPNNVIDLKSRNT
jgi:hypothetical protein